MKLIFGFILFVFISIAEGKDSKKIHPTIKITDFICHTEGVLSSIKECLEPEELKNIDTSLFQQANELLYSFEQIESNADNSTDLGTKVFVGIITAFGSMDVSEGCSAEPSAQLLDLISKMNFSSVDPTLLKNGIARFLAITTKKPTNEISEWIKVDIKKGEEVKCKRNNVSTHINEKNEKDGDNKPENVDL